jgi:hypothetical protein
MNGDSEVKPIAQWAANVLTGRLGVAVGVLLIVVSDARAFYWFEWPGSRIPREPSLIEPPHHNQPGNPPRPHEPLETGGPVPPTINPPVPVDRTPVNPPEPIPEPASGLLAIAGLTALLAQKCRQYRQHREK